MNDRFVGRLRIAVFASNEVVLAAPELDLISEFGVWILADKAIHHLHRFIWLANFVIGPRHLIKHFVVSFVVRIALKNLFVGCYGLPWSGRNVLAIHSRQCLLAIRSRDQHLLTFCCAPLKFLVRLGQLDRTARLWLEIIDSTASRYLWRCHLANLSAPHNAVSLLNLQVSQPSHRLWCFLALGCFCQISTVTLCSTFQAIFQIDVLKVRIHRIQLTQRSGLDGRRRAGTHQSANCRQYQRVPDHGDTTRFA